MKYAVVGNRTGWTFDYIKYQLDKIRINPDDTIISGGAVGVDTFAQDYAKLIGCTIIIHYPNNKLPSPERYFLRNKQIAEECDILIAFDRKSGRAGTKNTIAYARKFNKRIISFSN